MVTAKQGDYCLIELSEPVTTTPKRVAQPLDFYQREPAKHDLRKTSFFVQNLRKTSRLGQ
jgi:hypothetical protein